MRNFEMRTLILLIIVYFDVVVPHGRLMEPPNRSSLWRLPEFQDLDPPVEFNYDDDQNYCGGLGNTVNHGGRCGVCGDPWESPRPRPNENGGQYGQGLIVKNYKMGQVIDIAVELTTNHWGYFEWSLCKLENSNQVEPEDCFDKYTLQLGDGSGLHYNLTHKNPGWFNTTIKLPPGLQCNHCVLRWHYKAGNNWEFCNDDQETGSTDCGYQEIFRSCSDISINSSDHVTPRPKLTSTAQPDFSDEDLHPITNPTIPPMRPPKGSKGREYLSY